MASEHAIPGGLLDLTEPLSQEPTNYHTHAVRADRDGCTIQRRRAVVGVAETLECETDKNCCPRQAGRMALSTPECWARSRTSRRMRRSRSKVWPQRYAGPRDSLSLRARVGWEWT